MLESAGIRRPADIVVAVTGDDEDNIVICQLAKELYGIAKVVARVNDPRNQAHFDLLGIAPTVSATEMVMALVQHEMPQHELVHLVNLARENLEIVEVEVGEEGPRGRQARRAAPSARDRAAHLGDAGRATRRSRSARPSCVPATRCSQSSSREASTSCAGCWSARRRKG